MLLLYSGGLDTSVMLKWIQDEYEAEVVALTVNLGQPGEDFDVVKGKALQLGALDCHGRRRARGVRAATTSLPAIKANALYGGGYPLFTALGRPLIAKLAVENARETGCDTIAHGCTGKGNDQVRIEATVASLDPELKIDRAGAQLADGPRGGDRVRARARHPHQGRDRGAAVLDRRQHLGPLVARAARSRTSSQPPRRRRLRARHARPSRRPTRPRTSRSTFEEGCRSRSTASGCGLVELIERSAEIGGRHGVGIVDHIEDRIVGLKVRDIYEVPAAEILLTAHKELEKLVGTIHQNNFKPGSTASGPTSCTRGCGTSRCSATSTRSWTRSTAGHRHDHDAALQGRGAASSRARRRTRSTTRRWRASPSRAGCSPSRRARASSSCGRSSRGWRIACASVADPRVLRAIRG